MLRKIKKSTEQHSIDTELSRRNGMFAFKVFVFVFEDSTVLVENCFLCFLTFMCFLMVLFLFVINMGIFLNVNFILCIEGTLSPKMRLKFLVDFC